MSNPNAIIALCTVLVAPVLAACDSTDWGKYMAILSGQVDSLTDQQSDLLTRISALQADDDTDEADRVAREAELASLRQQLSELGNRLNSLGYPTSSDPQTPTPEPSQAIPDVSEECVSIFRVQTCEDGVLHHLDDQMRWID